MDRFVGKRLDGRYEIKEIIGVGGMAVVYKAYDNIEDRIVAIKILKEEFSSNEEFLRRFKNESKAIAVLSHPNIVKVYDVSFGEIFQYIVMEYIEGVTLKTFIEQNGSLPFTQAANFIIQILRGLQHAHDKGIVHRDIKPQNIMVCTDGTIKVTDFGIARFARNDYKTVTNKAIGSVHYISPEQARGETTNEKADIYSVGVMLYELLTGTLPFEADSAVSVAIMQLQSEPKLPSQINSMIPLGIEQITMRAMKKEPDLRYSSAAEMLRDLELFKKDPDMTFENNYFIDDAPTKYVPTDDEIMDEPEDTNNEKTPVIPILTGVLIAFGAVIVIILGILLFNAFKAPGADIECPNFVGYTKEQADKLGDYQLKYEQGYSPDIEAGKIYEQNPQAGKKIKTTTPITLYLSLGQKLVKVPDVTGRDVSMATSMLKAQKFTCEVVEIADEINPANTVIETSPAKDTDAPEGSIIKIFVSTGAPTVNVDLPNTVGLTLEDAKAMIEKAGLVVGTVKSVNSDALHKNIVMHQDPSSSSGQVGKGSAVNLEVGSGVTNYKFSVKVESFPSDFSEGYGCLSAWIDGKKEAESGELDFSSGGNYTFNLTTSKDVVQVVIKLKGRKGDTYYNYRLVNINCKTGTQSTVNYNDYPKK
ncbi:MAG: Stk1 family PASTA domain-containing Ser/Thr kinase [Oscillospiraceae bacterium]|nr:Stk1 family PASTA domain-containing Ser/Thr kinase [Candidatus Equicaccousia limihippi]